MIGMLQGCSAGRGLEEAEARRAKTTLIWKGSMVFHALTACSSNR